MAWQGTNGLIPGHYHLQQKEKKKKKKQLLPSELVFWYLQLSLCPRAGGSWYPPLCRKTWRKRGGDLPIMQVRGMNRGIA